MKEMQRIASAMIQMPVGMHRQQRQLFVNSSKIVFAEGIAFGSATAPVSIKRALLEPMTR
jgi:hypothetical protein